MILSLKQIRFPKGELGRYMLMLDTLIIQAKLYSSNVQVITMCTSKKKAEEYKCCGKTFKTKEELEKHKKTHK